MAEAWEEKSPRTEKVVIAASFRSGGQKVYEWRWEAHTWPSLGCQSLGSQALCFMLFGHQ